MRAERRECEATHTSYLMPHPPIPIPPPKKQTRGLVEPRVRDCG